jgi:hypothetical protein
MVLTGKPQIKNDLRDEAPVLQKEMHSALANAHNFSLFFTYFWAQSDCRRGGLKIESSRACRPVVVKSWIRIRVEIKKMDSDPQPCRWVRYPGI